MHLPSEIHHIIDDLLVVLDVLCSPHPPISLLVPCLCQLKQAGTMCRGPAGACDLPEYCTGASPYCPANVYLLDGSSCQYGLAYCYNGMCLTHEQQCLQLWGYGNDKSMTTHYKQYTYPIYSIFKG